MLGLKKGVVKLVPHDPKWKNLFKKDKNKILKSCQGLILDVIHIGSISMPNMPAKPIIDMVVGAKSLARPKKIIEKLELLGFVHDKDDDVEGRIFFLKGPDKRRTHHLSLVKYEGKNWNNYLKFVDVLKQNKRLAKEYKKLKHKLSEKYKNDRASYTKAKAGFISNVLNGKL